MARGLLRCRDTSRPTSTPPRGWWWGSGGEPGNAGQGHAGGSGQGHQRPQVRETALAGPGIVGFSTSIAIGHDGLGLISYYDVSSGHLMTAHCNDPACTAATIREIDHTGTPAPYSTGAMIGHDGFPLIAYYWAIGKDVKAAKCSNVDCTP